MHLHEWTHEHRHETGEPLIPDQWNCHSILITFCATLPNIFIFPLKSNQSLASSLELPEHIRLFIQFSLMKSQ